MLRGSRMVCGLFLYGKCCLGGRVRPSADDADREVTSDACAGGVRVLFIQA